MKKIFLVIIVVSICCCLFGGIALGYSFGYYAGKNSSNLDKVYGNYLNDILPDNVNDTTLIVYERHYNEKGIYWDGYYAYHNCNQSEYWDSAKQLDFYYENTFSHFNGLGIWHRVELW